MKKILLIVFIAIVSSSLSYSQGRISYTQQDIRIFDEYIEWISQYEDKSVSSLMVKTGKFFINAPYVAATLDQNSTEELVVNLREFDCTTFVEVCVALTKTVQSGNINFDNFCNILKKFRYRDGVIDGYSSRLHYMVDWTYNNTEMGLVEDVSNKFYADEVSKKISFMSSNSGKYKQLKKNKEEIAKMKEIEKAINERGPYLVVSAENIKSYSQKFQDGDIILFSSKKGNLDYYHLAIVSKTVHGTFFIHASLKQKEIMEERNHIDEYIYYSRSGSGATVIRLL